MTNSLTIGPVHTLEQNVVYAMPARSTLGYTATTAASLEADDEVTMTSPTPVTINADGSFSTPAPFIKCTSSTISISLRAQ